MTDQGHTEIRRYLLGDMTGAEREQIEERLLTDEEFFFELVEAEDDLVDQYVCGELDGEALTKFEKSLADVPSRREKVANARVLRSYIEEEKAAAERNEPEEAAGFWTRFKENFSIWSAGPAYAMAGLIVVLAVAVGTLVMENRNRGEQIAQLQRELGQQNGGQREEEIRSELEESQKREAELRSAIDGEKNIAGDLTADLDREREHRRKLEDEIEALRRQSNIDRPTRDTEKIETPSIATITLKPEAGGDVPQISLEGNTNRAAILLDLPRDTDKEERITVRLNDRQIAVDLPVRSPAGGGRSVAVTVAETQLQPGRNVLTAFDRKGKKLAEYDLSARKSEN